MSTVSVGNVLVEALTGATVTISEDITDTPTAAAPTGKEATEPDASVTDSRGKRRNMGN